jgi:hypothetical protein
MSVDESLRVITPINDFSVPLYQGFELFQRNVIKILHDALLTFFEFAHYLTPTYYSITGNTIIQ